MTPRDAQILDAFKARLQIMQSLFGREPRRLMVAVLADYLVTAGELLRKPATPQTPASAPRGR